jgi:uncharacterized protein (DUF779 family)
MSTSASQRVTATDAAIAEIRRLVEKHGPLVFVQSGGCCDGSSPICLGEGELLPGPEDIVLGDVDGCPVYVDREQYERWREPELVIDVAAGGGDSFSVEGPDGIHFVTRSGGERHAANGRSS